MAAVPRDVLRPAVLVRQHPRPAQRLNYQLDDAELVKLQLPNTAQIVGLFDGRFVISLKADWNYADNVYGAGSVLLAAPQTLQSGKGEIEQVVSQSREFIVEEIRVSDKGIAIVVLDNG